MEKTNKNCEELCEHLCMVLADTYLLYIKTQNYHWNVSGKNFAQFHAMFDLQYNDLASAIDAIAERIRALHHYAPGSAKQFLKLSCIDEDPTQPSDLTMVENLMNDHKKVHQTCLETLKLAEKAKEYTTEDFMIERMAYHEKTIWMLCSSLQK